MFTWLPREQHGIQQTERYANHQQGNSLESLDDHQQSCTQIEGLGVHKCAQQHL